MPYCLNHKMSLSLGNKAAPERKAKHKTDLTEVITRVVTALGGGEGSQPAFPQQPFWDHQRLFAQTATSVRQQGLAYLWLLVSL